MPLIAGFPLVLWAMALFFLGLGWTARVDIPLAVFAMTAALSFGDIERGSWRKYLQQHWPLVLFLGVAAITTTTSVDPRHSMSVQPQLLPALLCYTVIISFVTTLPRLRFACAGLLAGGILTAILMLVGSSQMAVDDPLVKVKLLGNGLLIVPNDVLLLSVIAPLALGLAWSGNLLERAMTVVYLPLALVACVVMHSRQAVVIWSLGLVVVAAWMRPRWMLPILLATTAVGLLVDGLMGWPLLDKIFMFPRSYVWHTAWAMFLDRPLLGQGPGMFKDLYYPFLEKAGYVLAELGDRRTMPWAHNLYLEQLAERGLPGLIALLCLVGNALLHMFRTVRQLPTDGDRGLYIGILSALLALLASGIAEASLSRLWVTVTLLVLVAFCSLGHPKRFSSPC